MHSWDSVHHRYSKSSLVYKYRRSLTLTFPNSIGQFCGALIWGSVADRIGRRPVYLLTLVITAILGLAIIFSPSFWFFCLSFSVLGLGVGGNAPASGAMFIEC